MSGQQPQGYGQLNALQIAALHQQAAGRQQINPALLPGGAPSAGTPVQMRPALPAGMSQQQLMQMQMHLGGSPGRPMQGLRSPYPGQMMPNAGARAPLPAGQMPRPGPPRPGAIPMKGYPQLPPGQRPYPPGMQGGPYPQPQRPPVVIPGSGGPMPPPKIIEEPPMDFTKPKTAKRQVDRRLPVEVIPLIPEAEMYGKLVEFEKRLDINIHKKKFDIHDALGRPQRAKRTLRIFVSNQAHDQPWQIASEAGVPANQIRAFDGQAPSWTLRVEGRIMEAGKRQSSGEPKFSSFVKSMVVEIQRDQSLFGDSSLIEWRKQEHMTNMQVNNPLNLLDGFEIRRKGDENVHVRILLTLDYSPERFKVAAPLARLLGITAPESKAGLVNKLWQYIKTQKLLDAEDKRVINLDDELQQIFSARAIMFPQIPDLINRHVGPMDPIEILYEVRVDTAKHLSKTAWDVEVEHEDLAKSRPGLVALGGQAGIATQKEITSMDNRIGDICRELDNSRLKRNFMLAFAEDPAGFTNRWVESQSEDLKLMLGDGKFNPEEIRRAGFFEKPEIEEAVYHYLNGRMAGTVGSHRVPEKK